MSVQALLSYALTVPDLEAGRRFYTTFGLLAAEPDNAIALRCAGREQDRSISSRASEAAQPSRFGSDRGLEDVRARMAAAGVYREYRPAHAFGDGLWLRDPDGNAVNLRVEQAKPACAPPRSSSYVRPLQPHRRTRTAPPRPPSSPIASAMSSSTRRGSRR